MRLRPRLTGLWQNPDFVKLWAGRTISHFGSLMGALQFTAVVALNASPFQMGLLSALGVAPGLLFGFVAGVWVDRLRRRPILIGTDIGRAASLASIPVAFFLGHLWIEHLYVVAFLNGTLRAFFDVAYGAYLPSLVSRDNLMEANSKLTASESVVETSAFSIGGWIVQLFSAMTAVVTDAVSFLISALFLMGIRKQESSPAEAKERQGALREISEGVKVVWNTPLLRAFGGSAISEGLLSGIVGSVILIYGVRELGFGTGVLGTIFAVGGISAFFGAAFAARITKRLGIGKTLILGLLIFSLSTLLIPIAQGPLIVAGAFLVAQQIFGDGPFTVYSVNEISLRQSVTPDRLLGRVNASFRFVGLGALLLGALLGGALAEVVGLRLTLVAGAVSGLLGVLWLLLSPVRSLKEPPAPTI